MKITYRWEMPNSQTFEIQAIKSFINQYLEKGKLWIDPFANNSRMATITNDLNSNFDTNYHLDAIDFLKQFDSNSIDGVLFDPPYSQRQAKECYENI